MLTVCVLTQTAALLTCVGCLCVLEVGCEKGGGAPAFCVFPPGEQTAKCVCLRACVVLLISLSLVLQ